MDYQTLKQEWLGRRVDFTKDGHYTSDDLISEYLWSTQDVRFELNGAALETLYNRVPDDLLGTLYTVQDPTPVEGDIVFLNGYEHWGVATGNQDANRFEMLEQDAVGSGTGIGDDAIRENYYPKEQMHGLWRMRVKAVNKPSLTPDVAEPVPVEQTMQAEVLALEPKVSPKYRPPTGALNVPRAIQRILVRVDLDTYSTPGLAVERRKPHEKKLRSGMHEFDELKYGMLRLAGDSLWINPLDNVVKPKVEYRPPQAEYVPDELKGGKEAEENYLDFKDDSGKLSEKYYTAKTGGAFVIDFKTGNTRTMPEGAHVWLAGITQVGGMGYGIATKCMEMEPVRYVGIRMGELYEDDTFNPKTTVEERKLLHTLKIRDYMDQATAKLQKKFIDIKGK